MIPFYWIVVCAIIAQYCTVPITILQQNTLINAHIYHIIISMYSTTNLSNEMTNWLRINHMRNGIRECNQILRRFWNVLPPTTPPHLIGRILGCFFECRDEVSEVVKWFFNAWNWKVREGKEDWLGYSTVCTSCYLTVRIYTCECISYTCTVHTVISSFLLAFSAQCDTIRHLPNTYAVLYVPYDTINRTQLHSTVSYSPKGLETTPGIALGRGANLNNVIGFHRSKGREGTLVINLHYLALNSFGF